MHIRSASFVKSVVGPDAVLQDGKPQIALIGRSNVGKSSAINALTRQKGLAKESSFPGRTTTLNVFEINRSFYLVDLPGYGFVASSKEKRNRQEEIIGWYLFESACVPRLVVLIIDANVGATDADLEMLEALEQRGHPILVVANKVDRLKKSELQRRLRALQASVGGHEILPFSAQKNIGVGALGNALERHVRG